MTTEAPSGSAEMSATRLAPASPPELGVGDGLTVGNKPAALPAWLCVVGGPTFGMPGSEPTDEMPGSEPAGSGEVTVMGGSGSSGGATGAGCVVAEVFGVVMATDADALAALGSAGAVPVTVRLTDVTATAVRGTVSCAWICRCAD